MATALAMIPVDPAVYNRKARQIRARFAKEPGAMHLALRMLAERSDRRPWQQHARSVQRSTTPVRPAATGATISETALRSPFDAALERGFTGHVADRLASGPFTFSDRMQLLRSAERLGISRFRANLIVSLVQNSPVPIARDPQPDQHFVRAGGSAWRYLFIALATELVVAGGLYLLLR